MKITLSVLLLFACTTLLTAQVGIGTTTPAAGALLDIHGDNGGIVIPRVNLTETTNQAPIIGPTPVTGLMVYNLANINDVTPGFYYWDGSAWERMASGASTDWALTGNAGTTPGTAAGENYIGTSDAQDVVIATDGDERMRIIENGRIGINQSTPIGYLHITSPLTGALPAGGPAIFSEISVTNSNWAALEAFNPNTAGGSGITGIGTFGVRGLGNFAVEGLGTAEGVYGQGLNGIIGLTTDNSIGWAGYFFGDAGVDGDMVADAYFIWSDIRVKSNLRDINNAMNIIEELNPVVYDKRIQINREKKLKDSTESINSLNERVNKNSSKKSKSEYGLIAQEVELILPNLIKEKKMNIEGLGEIDLKSVNYSGLIPILIQGIQEQQEIIDNQESRIAKLEALVNQLINKN